MNFGDMQTALARYGFTDSTDPIATWINSSMHDLETAADWPFLEEGPSVLATLNQGDYTISLPADFGRIITVRDITNLYKLKYWDRRKFTREIQDQTEQGLPELYTLIGMSHVQLWRVCQNQVQIEIVYEATTPDLVNSSDVPTTGGSVWPTAFHYPIVVHAAEIALMAENEEDRAQTASKQYSDMVMRLLGKYINRQLDDVEAVEDTQGYQDDMPMRGVLGGW